MADKIIKFKNVKKTYSAELKRKKTALTSLSLEVEKGEVFGIIGPNGAGKSTTLKILLGLVLHDSGEVSLNNHDPATPASHQHIGYLPESPCLYPNLSLIDHLKFAGKVARYPKKLINTRIDELLHLVNMTQAAKTAIGKYSKGMTQRAALAYALFHKPEIAILDEPMSGMDPIGRKLIIDIILEYNRMGNTVLFCSHILTDVQRICNRIGVMHKGRLATTLNSSQLSSELELEDIFLSTATK